jgi:hypothetical protein
LLPGAALLAAALVVVVAALREELTAPRVAHVGAVIDHGLSRVSAQVSAHPSWIALYGVIAVAVATAAAVAAHRHRPTGDHVLPVAVAAGTLWPLILLGLTQLAALAGVRALTARTDPAGGPRQA